MGDDHLARGAVPSFVPDEMRVNVLRITSYKDKNFEGYLENPFYNEVKWFNNLTHLLFLLEETADELNYPQRSNERRSIMDKPPDVKRSDSHSSQERHLSKPIASFKIRIMFRQNVSWQGYCEWMDEKKGANFRSALELVQLMDSVLPDN